MSATLARLPSAPFASLLLQGSTDRPAWSSAAKQALAEKIVAAHRLCTQAVETQDKACIRGMHSAARGIGEKLAATRDFAAIFKKNENWFKNGAAINLEAIRPKLKLVQTEQDKQLWSLARACWSMPYSKGYGRRLRFLVLDDAHDALIGILGLQSPPADLECRDSLFNFPRGEKLALINQTLDAYTIGAIPPYSFILGGKLCAGLLCSDPIREAYWTRYAAKKTIINNLPIQQPLVAITTTSAFGRSSMYNRLRHNGRKLAEPIGYTKGYGMFHLEHLYDEICDLLQAEGALTPNGYGNGPKVRWQNVTKALMILNLPLNLLAHGVQREVFLFNLTSDLASGMAGTTFGAPLRLSVAEFSEYWKARWATPRAARYPEWKDIDARALIQSKVLEWSALRH